MSHHSTLRKSRLAISLALALAAAPAFAQQTSSAVSGLVIGSDGNPISGASVLITHTPSGTVSRAITDENGRYNARGLRVGGPYTVMVMAEGFQSKSAENLQLQLAQTASVSMFLEPAAQQLESVEVIAAVQSEVFSPLKMGAGTNVPRAQIEALPSIKRSLEDYVRLDPRVVQVDKERGGITAAGQNNRYNNIKIDSVPTNDQFGLNDSGLPALNQPISIDWIQEFNIGVSDYDVTQTDFVGVNVNAVTRSGSNEFEGAVYGVYRDLDMTRKTDDRGVRFRGFEDEYTYGGYFSGPLIKDTLFFFIGYEKFERAQVGSDVVIGTGPGTVGVTAEQLAEIRRVAGTYGLTNIGSEEAPSTNPNVDDKYFAKFDWNINDDHRAAFRYNKTEGSVTRFNTNANTLQLDSNRYVDTIGFESYAVLLYSDWSDSFSTEANVSYAEYRSQPTPLSLFPQVSVNAVQGTVRNPGQVIFGRERSRHANLLAVDTWTGFFAGDWFVGDHTVRVGFDYEKNDVFNLFLQDVFGNYEFSSIDDFIAGRVSRYRVQRPTSGDINDVAADFAQDTTGLFVQDTWMVNNQLTLTYGLRVDINDTKDLPAANPRVAQVFGVNNQNVVESEKTLEPRIGFNYTFDTELSMQLRGGLGRFIGSPPGVWISNSFSNPGVGVAAFDIRNTTLAAICGGGRTPFNENNPCVPSGTGSAQQLVNFLSDDFKLPTVWKANLAFERELGWRELVAGAEFLVVEVDKGVLFNNLAVGTPVGVLPDGRNHYWASVAPTNFNSGNGNFTARVRNNSPRIPGTNTDQFTNAIQLENTEKGYSQNLTLSLEKPFSDNWYAKIAYTFGRSEEVSPGTSSVALSNWQNRAVYNPNEDVASRSNYEVRDRLTAAFSYRWNFFENAPTTFAAFYEGRSGRPYSYVFIGDANGDGQGGNDLFYVPAPGDVTFTQRSTAANIAAFNAFLQSDDCLAAHVGRVMPRNACRSKFRNQIDVRLTQELPLAWGSKAELFLDVLNIGNLINKEWGHIDEAAFPYQLGVARFAGVGANGRYIYDVASFQAPSQIRKDVTAESRWSAQIGFRVEF